MMPLSTDGSEFSESMEKSPISSTNEYVHGRYSQTKYSLKLLCENNNIYLNFYNADYVGNGRIFKLSDLVIIE